MPFPNESVLNGIIESGPPGRRYIPLLKHFREESGLDLANAKRIADKLRDCLVPPPQDGGEVERLRSLLDGLQSINDDLRRDLSELRGRTEFVASVLRGPYSKALASAMADLL